ncbi:MAG: D-hexose-6-phosphate mutarotase [Halothiobacillaceae bacterium]
MAQQDLAGLEEQFGLPGIVRFVRERGELDEVVVSHPRAQARVALQGAQLLEWQPNVAQAHGRPVTWVSESAQFLVGRPVRGGVPVCWPWFGNHPEHSGAHGFARERQWAVSAVESDSDAVTLTFTLGSDPAGLSIWPHDFRLTLTMKLGAAAELTLITQNVNHVPFTLTQGLHTYLSVKDLHLAFLDGLQARPYLDKLAGMARRREAEAVIRFAGEMDRIYLDTENPLILHDPAGQRQIRVEKTGSRSTVVWTPWREKAASLSGMEAEDYRGMVCIEATNAADDAVLVAPGETVRLGTRLSVEAL